MSNPTKLRRVVRLPEVKEATGWSEVQIWRYEKAGKFPKRFKLAEGSRAVGWWLDEIEAFQAARTSTSAA